MRSYSGSETARRFGLLTIGIAVSLSAAWAQSTTPASVLTSARQKYLGKKVTITGHLDAPHPAVAALYSNWRGAKKGSDGRYRLESEEGWSRLPYGYERHPGAIIAIQLSEKQPKQDGPSLDFIVKFDDNVIAMCSAPLEGASANFHVGDGKPISPVPPPK